MVNKVQQQRQYDALNDGFGSGSGDGKGDCFCHGFSLRDTEDCDMAGYSEGVLRGLNHGVPFGGGTHRGSCNSTGVGEG